MRGADRPSCPHCGSSDTKRRGWLFNRLYRSLCGRTSRWVCRACGTCFRGRRSTRVFRAFLIIASLLLAVVLCDFVHAMMSMSPKTWAKRKVVGVYQWYYGPGPEHRQKMHEHLGIFYEDVGEEIDDYYGHDY